MPGDETASPLPEMTRRTGVWGRNHISSPRDDLVSPRRPAIQLREEYLHTLHVCHIALAHAYLSTYGCIRQVFNYLMSTSNDTLNTPIPSGPSQSTLGNELEGPNHSQGQELHHEGQPQIQDQNPGQDDNEQDDPSLPGNFPAANAVLASCNSVLKDFRSSRISKATALSRIYTHLLDGIPDNDDSFASTIEEAFARYLTIVENHQHHLCYGY